MDRNLSDQIFSEVSTDMEKDEMYHIVNKIEELHPTIIVEIGVKYGGSLNFWRRIIPPNGLVIAIDSDNVLKIDINQDPRVKFLQGDSLNNKTYQDFISLLGNREIDFLFVDGGHAYRETKSDFYTFGWHVRKGGWVAFHDIYLDSEGDIKGSTKHFWEEVKKKSGRYWEIVSEIPLHTGTGIIKIL